ncbi:MAG: cob(I)yrinic acid a,c-diamide adenosyltransferase [Candidatus Pacebacteria bacterium]|nr:cob(I)yrinic acid a,c-diamide adenosyltransferase [Candidatus Paceibacterota bacterium]
MVNLSTKTGDKGVTSLANGQRLDKDDLRFELIGGLDELNSWLGVVIAKMKLDDQLKEPLKIHYQFLLKLQNELFNIGAEVASADGVELDDSFLSKLEQASDELQQDLSNKWQNRFVLPGGTEVAAWLDVSRTVCRRVERVLVAFNNALKKVDQNQVRPVVLQLINRLSDYLYVLKIYVNAVLNCDEAVFDRSKDVEDN